MRIMKFSGLALMGGLLVAPLAMAHTGHEHSVGILHVLSSPEHLLSFLLLGGLFGTVMITQRASFLLGANAALIVYLGLQAWTHAHQGDAFFGIEVATAGGLLTLGAWRAANLLLSRTQTKALKRIR